MSGSSTAKSTRFFYDRLLASRDKKAVKEEISRSEPGRVEPKEIIRDPYILEFLGIPQGEHFLETDLEQLLISRLQRFMLELGKGFAFVARQKRISFDASISTSTWSFTITWPVVSF